MNNSKSKSEYLHRIHKVQDYLEDNIHNPITIDELSEVAGFSKYHFHRIFKGIMNEPLSQYVNRLKLEKARGLIIHRPDLSLTDIAYKMGFTDSAVFSRTFKNYYKINPSNYRNQYSKKCKEPYKISQYNEEIVDKYKEKSISKNCDDIKNNIAGDIEIKDIDEINIIYARHIGSYKELPDEFPNMLESLMEFAFKNNISESGNSNLLAIYHDNPEFTTHHKLRTSLCLTVDSESKFDETDKIGKMSIPSGKYVVGHFEIFEYEYSDAWDFMYGEWMVNSGYKPRDFFPFEMYLNDPSTHPQNKHLVDIYLPIEPL